MKKSVKTCTVLLQTKLNSKCSRAATDARAVPRFADWFSHGVPPADELKSEALRSLCACAVGYVPFSRLIGRCREAYVRTRAILNCFERCACPHICQALCACHGTTLAAAAGCIRPGF